MTDIKDIAIRFKIDPTGTKSRAVPFSTVINVLSNLSKSYQNFLKVEILKVEDYRHLNEKSPDFLKSLLSDLKLNIIDLNYGSFEAAAAPDILDHNIKLFSDDLQDWKIGAYTQYKDDILYGDYTNSNYINSIVKRYTDIERKSIFNPLFSSVNSPKEYKVHLLNNEDRKIERTIVKPDKEITKFYTSVTKKSPKEKQVNTVQIYARVESSEGDLNKTNIKEFLYHETLEHDTYPFRPKMIGYDEDIYLLSSELNCQVSFEDDLYFITYEPFDMRVWGETRKDVELAFHFAFHALYQNYVVESDKNLSSKAIQLKRNIASIVDRKIGKE